MRGKIEEYIETWKNRCYFDGLPDEAPIEIYDRVPSYKRIAIAILKNDNTLKSLGFTGKESKYYGIFKRIELAERYKNEPKQLKIQWNTNHQFTM